MSLLPSLKPSELRKQSPEELQDKAAQLRAELARLRSAAGRGTLKKEVGRIRALRRNLARLLTVQNERGTGEQTEAK